MALIPTDSASPAAGSGKKRAAGEDLTDDAVNTSTNDEDEPTEVKLCLLASLYPTLDTETLLEVLLSCGGSIEAAKRSLADPSTRRDSPPTKRLKSASCVPGIQSSLLAFAGQQSAARPSPSALTKKGRTLYLFDPTDVAAHTPCSIIHNFLDPSDADALLRELLSEAPSYSRDHFQLFGREVTSPHTFGFYVDSDAAVHRQRTEYAYNGSYVADVRQSLPHMRRISDVVRAAVNREIKSRIASHYPGATKLPYQSPHEWIPNTSFVNCYDGARESVGYHSDQLTYLGPRAIIGSISLGVAREFRVRRVVPRNTSFDPLDEAARKANDARADSEGQISIHLPHNSLLVMHAEMQEEWKHSIAPAHAIEPHPIAGNKRLNITYRHYREAFQPRFTPKCNCGMPTVLRTVQKQQINRGRYAWICYTMFTPGRTGCSFFQWAEFDDDGEPPWAHAGNLKEPPVAPPSATFPRTPPQE